MSLLRLLTAGRCLIGLKDTCNRYRVNQGALLPKFESAPNPFRKTVLPGKSAQDLAPDSPVQEPAAAAGAVPGDAGTKDAISRPGLAGRVTSGLRNLVKGGPPADARQPVQSELALDNVRVIRNDLSESDLEVVPVRKPPVTATPAVAPAPQSPGKVLGGWAERGRSLFRRSPAREEIARP